MGKFMENFSGEIVRGVNLRAGRAHFAGVPKLKFRVVAQGDLATPSFWQFTMFLTQFW